MRAQSLKFRLLRTPIIITFLVLVGFSILLFSSLFYLHKNDTSEILAEQTKITASNLVASTMFRDVSDMQKSLHALTSNPKYLRITITDNDKATIFEHKNISGLRTTTKIHLSSLFTTVHLMEQTSILSSSGPVGKITIVYSLDEFRQFFTNLVLIIISLVTFSMLIALWVANRFQKNLHNSLQAIFDNISEIAHTNDFSKRFKLEDFNIVEMQDFAKHLNHLLKEVESTHKNLAEAQHNAEHALKVKSEFLHNMSHEIRTPMNSIISIADIIDESHFSKKDKQYLRVFEDSCSTLLTMINDVLDLSKFESNQFSFDNEPFDLYVFLENIVTMFTPDAKAKNLDLSLNYDPGLSRYYSADQVRLRQILVNFVSNSVKFTQEGSISIIARSDSRGDEQEWVYFEVRDSGIGIPADKIEQVFEPFTQSSDIIYRTYGGTGLGLSISKKLIELFGGEIEVQSIENKYTQFSFTIPLTIAKQDEVVQFKEVEQTNPKLELNKIRPDAPVKILVAEDSPENIMVCQRYLEDELYEVTYVENGEDAVNKYKESQFDVILMDIYMPKINGIEATKKIREYERLNKLNPVPIVAFTAYAMHEDVAKCISAGCDDHVSKPVRKAKLLTCLNHHAKSGK